MPIRKIQSLANPEIRRVLRIIQRKDRSYWILEGKKLLEEARSSRILIQEVLASFDFWETQSGWIQELAKMAPVYLVPASIMRKVSSLKTPQGILGIAARPEEPAHTTLQSGFSALLTSIRDPGNFGTIVRSAEASGCLWLAYSFDCVDPFQPKVLRSSMGSLFRVPLKEIRDTNLFLKQQKENGVTIYALSPRGGTNLFGITPKNPALIVLGSESHGLPQSLPVDKFLSIPMSGKVESLNVAMAATLCFYRFGLELRP
jgi:TrmH family RNA methyltransferase